MQFSASSIKKVMFNSSKAVTVDRMFVDKKRRIRSLGESNVALRI